MERAWEMVQEDQPQEEPVDDQQFGEGDGRDELLMQRMNQNITFISLQFSCYFPNIERKGICYTMLYVMAFTSGKRDAGSDNLPYLFLDLYTHRNGYVRIPDNPGNDMLENKGDLWKIPISSVSKLGKKCMKKEEINKIVIHNGGNDGWLIESVVTVLRAGRYYTVLTANIGMNYGIDGDLNLKPSSHQITLTKVP